MIQIYIHLDTPNENTSYNWWYYLTKYQSDELLPHTSEEKIGDGGYLISAKDTDAWKIWCQQQELGRF